jgi:hypothetical protein
MGRSSKANGRAPAPSRSCVRARWHPSGPAGRRRPPADLARDAERDSRRGPLHVLGMSAIPGSALSRGPPPHLRHTARSPPGAPAGDHHTPLAGRAAPHSLSLAIVSSLSPARAAVASLPHSLVSPLGMRCGRIALVSPPCMRRGRSAPTLPRLVRCLVSKHAPWPRCSPHSLLYLQSLLKCTLSPCSPVPFIPPAFVLYPPPFRLCTHAVFVFAPRLVSGRHRSDRNVQM